jgi:hypothetical protein
MKNKQNYLWLGIYLLVFVLLPFVVAVFLSSGGNTSSWVWYLGMYSIFVAPFLFIIPYKLSKFVSKAEKLYFIFFGFVIPFVLIYYYIYLDFQKNFHPGF